MRILFQIILELWHILTYPFSFIISLFIPRRHNPNTTVLIVERWFTRNVHHKPWKIYLEKKGFDVHAINFPIYRGSFDDSAERLKEYIDENDFTDIVLVGISAGGITALLYLEDYSGWEKVRKFISVGTPFYGSPMTFFTSFTKSGRELLPISTLVQNMKERKIQKLDKIVCIQAKYDEMVPRDSTALKGAKKIQIDVIGHNNLHLATGQTYETIANLAK